MNWGDYLDVLLISFLFGYAVTIIVLCIVATMKGPK